MIHSAILKQLGVSGPAQIRNIIFDLGNVLIDIDLNRTIEGFHKLGISNFDTLYSFEKQNEVFDRLEIGTISDEDFRSYVRKHLPGTVADDAIDSAWAAMLSDLPEYRVAMLRTLKTKYRLFLLSNTNAIHVRQFVADADRTYGKGIFDRLFEKTYYSNEIRLRKPNKDIFDFVIRDAGIDPSQTLFIDDMRPNTEGARKAGLFSYCLEKQTIAEVFNIV